MGLLNLFNRPTAKLMALPSGCFTVDPEGRVLVSTLPQSFPAQFTSAIAAQVLASFRAARAAQLPLSQLVIRYSSLKITARDLRGGALVFVAPQTLG